nr:uncharacterized protein LOC121127678 [Lepeophtheirus salmonis]
MIIGKEYEECCEKVRTPTLHGKGNRKISKHGYGYVLINNEPEDTKCLLKLKPSCSFTSRKFYLRGLSPDIQSKVDYKYINMVQGSHLIFKGFSKSKITNINNSNGTNLWVIMDTFDYLKIFAFYNGSKLIPWGINIWFFKGNNNEVIQERLLKLTKCTASEFSCDDSNCIPRSSVCNDVADCFSGEDEINCGSIGLNAYQKEFPPSSNENGQKKIPLQIQFHLKSINFIDEMGELLEVRYQLKLKWRDSRIIFYNLINDKRHILTDNEINRIWSPLLMFEKSVEEDKILLDKKNKIALIMNETLTWDPIQLLKFKISGLGFISCHGSDAIRIHIILKRMFINLLWTTYLPTFCLQVVAMLTLFFPQERFETTIMITLTTTLVMYTLYQSVSFSLPATGYVKLIDTWLIFCLILLFFIFVLEVIIELCKLSTTKKKNRIALFAKCCIISCSILFDVWYSLKFFFYVI